jgi:enoyl-CoA hydratase/carnithine racemase
LSNHLLLVQKKSNICTLTLNRPEKKNSLSLELIEQIKSTMEELAEDDGVRTAARGRGSGLLFGV